MTNKITTQEIHGKQYNVILHDPQLECLLPPCSQKDWVQTENDVYVLIATCHESTCDDDIGKRKVVATALPPIPNMITNSEQNVKLLQSYALHDMMFIGSGKDDYYDYSNANVLFEYSEFLEEYRIGFMGYDGLNFFEKIEINKAINYKTKEEINIAIEEK